MAYYNTEWHQTFQGNQISKTRGTGTVSDEIADFLLAKHS